MTKTKMTTAKKRTRIRGKGRAAPATARVRATPSPPLKKGHYDAERVAQEIASWFAAGGERELVATVERGREAARRMTRSLQPKAETLDEFVTF